MNATIQMPQHQPIRASIRKEHAMCHIIYSGGEYAEIFLRHGMRQEAHGPANWVSVSIASTLGSFSYCWSNCGPLLWNEFLTGLSFDYAMRKLLGASYMIEDVRGTARAALDLILELRLCKDCTAEDARQAWNRIQDALDQGMGMEGLMYTLSEIPILDHETMDPQRMRELQRMKLNPLAKSFWEAIWEPWIGTIAIPEAA